MLQIQTEDLFSSTTIPRISTQSLFALESISGAEQGGTDVALGEGGDVVVGRGNILQKKLAYNESEAGRGTYQKPLRFDSGNGSDVVLGGENKFVVQDPVGVVAENGGRV